MCEHGDTVPVQVNVPAWIAHSGEAEWRAVPVDRCIAPIVQALVNGDIYTAGSCCGHGRGVGAITLQDGRSLIITPDRETEERITEAERDRTGIRCTVCGGIWSEHKFTASHLWSPDR